VEQGVTNIFTTRKFQSVSGFILAQKAAIMQIGGSFFKKKTHIILVLPRSVDCVHQNKEVEVLLVQSQYGITLPTRALVI
jgi:hypothetical protein